MIQELLFRKDRGSFALLVDPDKHTDRSIRQLARLASECKVDALLLGGSLVRNSMENALAAIKEESELPVVLFPGSIFQFCPNADAILLLSLISGRNPEFLIGNHVVVAHTLNESGMEIIPTGYILIESGLRTSVQYMSNTSPIPRNKPDIAVATALAGQQLGLRAVYLEAGSGATEAVPIEMIKEVRENIKLPIIVGGGIRKPDQVLDARKAGANMIVVGTALEREPTILRDLVAASR
jgi:putative glycerol-1-phosphate prenyltransferase